MYTIMTNDHERCYICSRPACEWHHILHGSDKWLSEKYGLMIPICRECHNRVHHYIGDYDRKLKEEAQRQFLIEIFGRCYL